MLKEFRIHGRSNHVEYVFMDLPVEQKRKGNIHRKNATLCAHREKKLPHKGRVTQDETCNTQKTHFC